MKDNLYVVYHVYHNDVIVYVGYGNQTRPAHATSGVSNNYHLNRLHHTGEILDTRIVYSTTDKEKAKKREKEDIINYAPIYNTVYITTSRQDAANKATAARIRIDNIIKSLDRNKASTQIIKRIFDTLLKMFTIPQLLIGVNIQGIEAQHFNQLRRLAAGERQTLWFSALMGTGLVEFKKDAMKDWFVTVKL